ncbi:MAG: FAD-binding protein, partial [Armatimonadota bacterium]
MLQCEQRDIAEGLQAKVYTVQTLVIGSGAAGLNCCEHLYELGQTSIAMVTDCLGAGASNNSGSDKQTYYKLGIFGDVPDSPMEFARTLAAGGMMHGDIAYVEGLGSAPEFFHLVRNGVPFPFNQYGGYVGYKTDFDPRQRATSAGPKTSIMMVAKSLERVRGFGIPILDQHDVIRLLTAGEGDEKRVIGAVAINKAEIEADNFGLTLFNADNVVMATGGPGEMYAISVYPEGQIGNHGLALEIGAIANNLTESQYGLASIGFRWNLSGTYQQVVPCYFSTDAEGRGRRYFLNEYFDTMTQVGTNTFLKGYQWPVHADKLQDMGSSVVDVAVNNEIAAGRRVFMDFTANPAADAGLEDFDLGKLEPEALDYLKNSGAMQPTPIERLEHMNPLSIDLYAEHDVDLREPLEVAVCAQHCNGGMRGNAWWESNIRHLFPVGELNGSHGVRPGGSALNSGQVGGLRAATYIANVYKDSPMDLPRFLKLARPQVEEELQQIRRHLRAGSAGIAVADVRRDIQARMSEHGAFLRDSERIDEALNAAKMLDASIATHGMRLRERIDLVAAIQNDHLCLTHVAFLEAIKTLIERGGGSRGSYVVLDSDGDQSMETK